MMSPLAEVSVLAKSGPRPMSMYPGKGAEVDPRQSSPGAWIPFSVASGCAAHEFMSAGSV